MPGVPPVIPGFPSSNRVPSVGGLIQTGTGGQSAATLPKRVLVVGLKTTAGNIVPDNQIQPILSPGDADNYGGVGSELACMLYDAIPLSAALGIPLFACSPTPAAGAVAATTTIRFNGTATATGQVTVRSNGKPISQGIPFGMTAAQAATALAGAISGYASGRQRVSATAGTVYCTVTCNTAGVRGNQDVVFLDISALPAGITATLYVTWAASQTWAVGDQVIPKAVPNGLYFKCTTAGAGSVSTEPTWPTTVGTTVTDGSAVWTCWGSTATGNLPTTALFLGSGSGLETYTNLLATVSSQSYDRIGLAANDTTSVAAWKVQLDQYNLAPTNYLQQLIVCTNGSVASSQSLGQTTLNDVLFQNLWQLNSETHPSRLATQIACTRAGAEQQNPNASYDGYVMPYAAPQTQPADWPTLATLISAINNSVTPLTSGPFGLGPGGDGVTRVVRSITTKSLTGGFADYSTIDTGMITVAQFVFLDAKVLYLTQVKPANPVVSDDPPSNQRKPRSGVLTPSSCTATYNGKLVQYSQGILSNSPVSGSATIPPMIQPPNPGDVQCTFDPVAIRIIMVETIYVMPIDHSLGVIVNQAA